MSEHIGPRRSIALLAAGAVGFLIVNVIVGAAANPRFPNEEGPMPRWLPAAMLAMVVGLALLAARHAPWRRIAAGFVFGYLLLAVGCNGQLTTSWSIAATRLHPTREPARRRREDAARDSALVEGRARYVARMSSAEGRTLLARTAFDVMRCAFAYRAQHASDGFPSTLQELGLGGGECARHAVAGPRREGTPHIALAARAQEAGLPVTRLGVRLTPDPRLMPARLPLFVVDERGIVTVRTTAAGDARVVASPVPALLQLRRCLLATGRLGTDASAGVRTRLEMSAPPCDSLRGRMTGQRTGTLPPGTVVLQLHLDADSRLLGSGAESARWYQVSLQVDGSGDADVVTVHAWPFEGRGTGRSYLVARDGSVHAVAEARDATEADPLAEACEVDPGVPCR
jgi:hypothetical protein